MTAPPRSRTALFVYRWSAVSSTNPIATSIPGARLDSAVSRSSEAAMATSGMRSASRYPVSASSGKTTRSAPVGLRGPDPVRGEIEVGRHLPQAGRDLGQRDANLHVAKPSRRAPRSASARRAGRHVGCFGRGQAGAAGGGRGDPALAEPRFGELLGEVACHLVGRGQRPQLRSLGGAALRVAQLGPQPATGMEPAARRRVDRGGNVATEDDPAAVVALRRAAPPAPPTAGRWCRGAWAGGRFPPSPPARRSRPGT